MPEEIDTLMKEISSIEGVASVLLIPMRMFVTEIDRANKDAKNLPFGSVITCECKDDPEHEGEKVATFTGFRLSKISNDFNDIEVKVVIRKFVTHALFTMTLGNSQSPFVVLNQVMTKDDWDTIETFLNGNTKSVEMETKN